MGRVNLEGISDIRKYQDLALLVDRQDFQQDIAKLRNDIAKIEYPNQHEKYKGYYIGAEQSQLAKNLALKYQYPHGFGKALLAAALNNKITDADMVSCYVNVHRYATIFPDEKHPYYPQSNEIVLSVYPYMLKDKINKVLEDIRVILDIERKNITQLPKHHPLSMNTIPQIRIQRTLYWMRKELNIGYVKLAKSVNMPLDTVRNHIRSYTKLLKEVW